jgi:hypothetical protein
MIAAPVAADELGISDEAAYHMHDSALELKRRSAAARH